MTTPNQAPLPTPAVCVLYARSATSQVNSPSVALERQLYLCREYAAAHGLAVAGEYSEVGSANGPLPALEQAIAAAAAAGPGTVLVVYDAARLGRTIVCYLQRRKQCEERGVSIRYVCAPVPQHLMLDALAASREAR